MAENIANKNMCKFYVTRDKKMCEALCKQRDETFDQECDSICMESTKMLTTQVRKMK